jgi:hypothetical protein
MARKPSDRIMRMQDEQELNLAPIMNMVMILIPLLLVGASFVTVASLEVHSPRNAQSTNPEPDTEIEEVPVPRVLVAISENGFTISDLRNSPAFLQSGLSNPTPDCASRPTAEGAVPVTVCARQSSSERLLDRLNYRDLYNRLVEVKNYSAWAAQWDDSNSLVNIVADREIPVEVVIRTMDIARFFLENNRYDDEAAFRAATYRTAEGGAFEPLFQDPVLLLPRAAAE